jgi:hypothetical protein
MNSFLIVSTESADPGVGGARRPLAVAADHISICKPVNRNSPVFTSLRHRIGEVLRSCLPTPNVVAEIVGVAEALKDATAAPIEDGLKKHRAENERLAYKLHIILRDRKDILGRLAHDDLEDHRLVTAAGFLVSIVFSLWRAVSYCPPDYQRDQTLSAAKTFLGKVIVIGDNEIPYTGEKENRYWAFSYYLNNAGLRLDAFSSQEDFKDFKFVDPDVFSIKQLRKVWHKRPDAWRLCHEAAEAAIDKLETALAAEARRK